MFDVKFTFTFYIDNEVIAPPHKQFLVYFHLLQHEIKESISFDFCNILLLLHAKLILVPCTMVEKIILGGKATGVRLRKSFNFTIIGIWVYRDTIQLPGN